jgi:hypothetical protein
MADPPVSTTISHSPRSRRDRTRREDRHLKFYERRDNLRRDDPIGELSAREREVLEAEGLSNSPLLPEFSSPNGASRST